MELNNEQNLFKPTSNLSSYELHSTIEDKYIRMRLKLVFAVELADSTVELGTFDYSKMGIKDLSYSIYYMQCSGDGTQGGILIALAYDTGVLSSYDIIPKVDNTTIPKDQALYCNFVIPVSSSNILDSAAGEFHFKRTA